MGIFDIEYLKRIYYEANTDADIFEKIGGRLKEQIILDKKNKVFIIKGIHYDKFLLRLKEMYKYRGIINLFEKKYSALSIILYNKERIKKSSMKIIQLEVPLFFAIEVYNVFMDLADFYNLKYYEKCAENIWNKTWISNFEKRNITSELSLSKLSIFNYTLKDYQLEFIKRYEDLKYRYDLDGYVLSFDQGLGKTFTAIALAECLNKDQIIIICPNSLKENWAYEIRSYYKKYTKNDKVWRDDLYINGLNYKSKNPKFIITNNESIDKIFPIIKKNKNSMIIVDESQNFRNDQSQQSKQLFKLKELVDCTDNLMMSGTPIKATPDEIIPVLYMIDPYFTEEIATLYKKAFSNSSNDVYKIVKNRFDRIIYRRRKADVLQLPEKNIEELRWEAKDEKPYLLSTVKEKIAKEFEDIYQEKLEHVAQYRKEFESMVMKYSSASKKSTEDYLNFIYKKSNNSDYTVHEHREDMYNQFLNDNVYPNINNKEQIKRLQYIVSQYIFIVQSARGTAIGKILPPTKTNCYIDIADNNINQLIVAINNNPKKTIIFTPFLDVAKHVYNILLKNKIGSVLIVGETKNRMTIIQEFKESDDIDVLIATVQTLSTGVTLTEANQMFFFGTPYRSADFDQACDRIHRIGQTTECHIYKILLKSSTKNITDRIDEIMQWSGDLSGSIIDSFI